MFRKAVPETVSETTYGSDTVSETVCETDYVSETGLETISEAGSVSDIVSKLFPIHNLFRRQFPKKLTNRMLFGN